MTYKIIIIDNLETLIHQSKGAIPVDEMNSDYRDYLAWVAEGNVAEPWQPEEPPVEEVTAEEPVIEDAN